MRGHRAYVGTMVNPPVIVHLRATPPCFTPFKIFVTGSNLQNGIRVYIDGVQWYDVAWKNTGKIILEGCHPCRRAPGLDSYLQVCEPRWRRGHDNLAVRTIP